MADIETIKNRIKKLMAVAGDGIATDGEISNAMSLAMSLIDKHNLDKDEFEKKEGKEEDITYGRTYVNYSSKRVNQWETKLAQSICKLYGTVKCWIDAKKSPFRYKGVLMLEDDGTPVYTPTLHFYGPITDCEECKDLFYEWAISIGTMAQLRWGGCYRGLGAQYCDGFTNAIYAKLMELDTNRQLVQATTPKQFGNPNTAITLFNRYKLIKKGATEWLRDTQHINLCARPAAKNNRDYNSEAYNEGYNHGKTTNFGKKAGSTKLLGN